MKPNTEHSGPAQAFPGQQGKGVSAAPAVVFLLWLSQMTFLHLCRLAFIHHLFIHSFISPLTFPKEDCVPLKFLNFFPQKFFF